MDTNDKIAQLLEKMVNKQNQTLSMLEQLDNRVTKVEITQENVIVPNIQLLAEGHITIQEQIKNISVIDRLQDDVATLKNAVRFLSQKIEQMEKAM